MTQASSFCFVFHLISTYTTVDYSAFFTGGGGGGGGGSALKTQKQNCPTWHGVTRNLLAAVLTMTNDSENAILHILDHAGEI